VPDKSTYLTTEQAAKLLNVHPNTILRWIKGGKLPYSQIGQQYRIPREAIENRVGKAGTGTRVIAVANQKGGVAKTTTTLNLAAGLGKKNKRVLVIDLDPQGGCAVSLGITTDSLNKTVYTVLMNDETGFRDVILKSSHGFDLAPSNIDLAGAEIELKQLLAAEQILKNKLDDIVEDYDFVLFDCPPSLGMLTINALTAAREILIPMSMEFLALRGLDMLAKTVSKVRAITNPELTYLGILATKYDKRTLNSREIFEALQKASKDAGIRMFNTYITSSVRFAESPNAKAPLLLFEPEHEGAKAYAQIVEEVINGKT
jgi:chromosome partitioning protein